MVIGVRGTVASAAAAVVLPPTAGQTGSGGSSTA